MFCKGHELVEFFEPPEDRRMFEQDEAVSIEVLEHLLEGSRVVGVKVKGLLAGTTGITLSFVDFFRHFWRLQEDGFVAMKLEVGFAKFDLVDC